MIMKKTFFSIFAAALLLAGCNTYRNDFLLETECFSDKGGWVLNQQYMDQMGSPYLMAHGIGTPVTDARTEIALPAKGEYHIFVRTFNWTSPWYDGKGPGAFKIAVDGAELPDTLGVTGNGWMWQYAGKVDVASEKVNVTLKDLSGFDGRCDAIYFSKRRNPDLSDLKALRSRFGYDTVSDSKNYEFVVVGGGLAGMAAAVSAARLGVKTALVHDRAVLGGNNSSEIRVHTSGHACFGLYPNLGLLMREFGHQKAINGENDGTLYCDDRKEAFVSGQANLDVYYNEHAVSVEKDGDRIVAVISQNTESGALTRFTAPLFSDCTGDACIGYLAGADFKVGRESKDETGERSAAKIADNQVLGASVLWNTLEMDEKVDFPDFVYGLQFTDESVQPITNGEWTWETGMRRDQVAEAERIRDYGMLVAYSNWAYLKNHYSGKDAFSNRRLNWVSYLAGKRESRRLMGDYVLNQTDIEDFVVYPDASVTLSWSIDLHYPDPSNTKFFPGEEFISVCNQDEVKPYPIPYRCFYSRNVPNLFMAGRNISVTHAALGTVRVMRTTEMMGEVVGMAASICKANQCLPRGVYESYLDDLKALMTAGVGDPSIPDNQNFHLGHGPGWVNEKFSSPDVE